MQKVSNYRRRHLIGIACGIFVAFLVTVACYWPSLNGPFLFDDIPNLEAIGEHGGLISQGNFFEFILSGRSGPLGRPFSLASFAVDGQAWPADPRPFRVTNLIIHLLNGLLVFLLTRLIFSTLYERETAEKFALLCMVMWLLHPLLVSTTAYIIQRMTQLASLFTLTGLLAYMRGRVLLCENPLGGWTWIVAGMGVSGILALLSKETGILLPIYALIIELTVFQSVLLVRPQRQTLIAIFCAPLVILIAYMAIQWDATLANFELRPFTAGERFLTQAVVLIDYLRQVIAPQLSGLGLFHDDFPISRGLLEPVITLASLLTIATLLFLAVWLRKAWPLISFGILWFFVGHSLEAGPIALELYFEHRNYLPLLGPLVAFCSSLPFLTRKLRRLLPLFLLLFVGMEGWITWQAAIPWGNEDRLMRITLIEHPNSLRAQQYVANKYILQKNFPAALAVQERLAAKIPQHAATRLSIVNLRCILDVLTTEQIDTATTLLRHSDHDLQLIGYLRPLIANVESNNCASLGYEQVHALFDALLTNPIMANSRQVRGAIHYHKGIAFRLTAHTAKAFEHLDISYAANPDIDILLRQVVWSLEAGNTDSAEHYLALAEQHGNRRILGGRIRQETILALRRQIDRATRK